MVRRLNRRQRKKLHVGEFREWVFEVCALFHRPLEEAQYNVFLDDFIELIESRRLIVGGMGGKLPLVRTSGVVSVCRRGSVTETDRDTVLNWVQSHPEVAWANASKLVDGW
jgi:uncharacterized protein YggL (DUF469 family)